MPIREEITYILVDDQMPNHDKFVNLTDKAWRRVVEGWCWCSANHRDGTMPWRTWELMTTKPVRDELEEVGLVRHDATKAVFHDYLDIQRSQAEIADLLRHKSEAGKKGNHRRHHVNKGVRDENCPFCLRGVA